MDPMTISLIAGAVLGEMKNQQNQKQYKEGQKLEAIKEKWAPFTGQRGKVMQRPNSMDPMMQSLLTAAMFGQQFGKGAPTDGAAAVDGSQAGNSYGVMANQPGPTQPDPGYDYMNGYAPARPAYAPPGQ